MKKYWVILAAVFCLILTAGQQLSAVGRDFSISELRVNVQSGDVRATVRYTGGRPFRNDVYMGIWFNGKFRRPVKRNLVFTNNNVYDVFICNYSHLGTTMGEGILKVRVDATNQYPEVDESNNFYQEKVWFFKVVKIELKVDPAQKWLREGQVQTFNFTAKFTVEGRGSGTVQYFKHYTRTRIKPIGRELLTKKKTGPFTFDITRGTGGYFKVVKTIKWSKMESYDNRTQNGEYHDRTYKVVTQTPNYKESNKALWKIRYMK